MDEAGGTAGTGLTHQCPHAGRHANRRGAGPRRDGAAASPQ